jgi:CRP/FNR family transcriptional regulator, cyclic AMP receptor protein
MVTTTNHNKINILSELNENDVQRLLDHAMVEDYGRRDVVYLPGDERSHVYIVIRGMVKLARLSEDGREIIIDTVEEGEMFGELAVINPGEHDTMAEMMTKGKIAAIPADQFEDILAAIPRLSFLLARVIGVRRMVLESKLEDLAFRNVPARLARFLMEQAALFGKQTGAFINVPSQYSQQEIGSMIGSTRETTSHFLNDFRRSGIIDFNKRSISILDPERLTELGGVF